MAKYALAYYTVDTHLPLDWGWQMEINVLPKDPLKTFTMWWSTVPSVTRLQCLHIVLSETQEEYAHELDLAEYQKKDGKNQTESLREQYQTQIKDLKKDVRCLSSRLSTICHDEYWCLQYIHIENNHFFQEGQTWEF